VANAELAKAKKGSDGKYTGGEKSFKNTTLSQSGTIWPGSKSPKHFVGAGRLKR